MQAPTISIQNAHLAFANKPLFSNLELTLSAGKWIALLGRSGVGKSSLLRALAGLCPPFKGQISPSDLNQHIAYMAQTDLLIPWKTVLDNVMLGAILRGKLTPQIREHAMDLLNQVGLQHVASFYPRQLSGGMRQRVALIRTLLEQRPIVLMDEPFSALDAITRFQLHELTTELLTGKTVFFVTHDPLEALRLADEIYIMHPYPRPLVHILSLALPKPRPISNFLADKQQVLYDELNA